MSAGSPFICSVEHVRDLLLCAKHLFVEAMVCLGCGVAWSTRADYGAGAAPEVGPQHPPPAALGGLAGPLAKSAYAVAVSDGAARKLALAARPCRFIAALYGQTSVR